MSATDQATLEQWHVQVEAGDVRLWTLDQLDAAFKAELVDESTFVLEVGKTEWMTLGTLLGGDDEPAAPVAPARVALQIESYTPIAPVMFHDPNPSNGPNSTAPMASDIDDESPASFRSSRKRPVALGFGAVLLAAGVAAFAFTHGHGPTTEEQAPAVAAVAPPPAPPPAPVVADTPPESPASVAARLSHDQLLKLADADRAREVKVAATQKARAAAAPHRSHGSHSKEKSPFHNGGDQHDPLNAKL